MAKKKWLDADRLIEKYDDPKYIHVDIGINTIDPSKIVALSRELDDFKLKRLRENVAKNGWQDKSPMDFMLFKTPDGKFAVGGGGNHRAFLSNEMGLNEVKAQVTTVFLKSQFSSEQLVKYEYYNEAISDLHKKIRNEKDEEKRYELIDEVTDLGIEKSEFLYSVYKSLTI